MPPPHLERSISRAPKLGLTGSHTQKQHKTILSDLILSLGSKNVTVDELWENNKQSKTLVLTFGGSGWAEGLGVVGKWAKIVAGTRIRRTLETEPETED